MAQVALVTKYMARGSLHDVLVKPTSEHYNASLRSNWEIMVKIATQGRHSSRMNNSATSATLRS